MPLPWHLLVWVRRKYGLHDPESLIVILRLLELLIEDDVLAGELESGREEVVLIGLLLVILLIQSTFELLQVLVEHVLAAELVPTSEVIDAHVGQDAVLLEHPVHLFLLAPDYVPVVIPRLLPLPVDETVVYAVLECCLELYARTESNHIYGGVG